MRRTKQLRVNNEYISALTLPLHPARSLSSGITDDNLVTYATFSIVDTPCDARISMNNAFRTGTRANKSAALRNRLCLCTSSAPADAFLSLAAAIFSSCSAPGLNPYCCN